MACFLIPTLSPHLFSGNRSHQPACKQHIITHTQYASCIRKPFWSVHLSHQAHAGLKGLQSWIKGIHLWTEAYALCGLGGHDLGYVSTVSALHWAANTKGCLVCDVHAWNNIDDSNTCNDLSNIHEGWKYEVMVIVNEGVSLNCASNSCKTAREGAQLGGIFRWLLGHACGNDSDSSRRRYDSNLRILHICDREWCLFYPSAIYSSTYIFSS